MIGRGEDLAEWCLTGNGEAIPRRYKLYRWSVSRALKKHTRSPAISRFPVILSVGRHSSATRRSPVPHRPITSILVFCPSRFSNLFLKSAENLHPKRHTHTSQTHRSPLYCHSCSKTVFSVSTIPLMPPPTPPTPPSQAVFILCT